MDKANVGKLKRLCGSGAWRSRIRARCQLICKILKVHSQAVGQKSKSAVAKFD
jgi:hypothetical protein